MAVLSGPINWLKVRRRVSMSSWVSDRIAEAKMLQLCSACEYRMPHRWTRRYHYVPFMQAHGVGQCDSCRREDTLSIYMSSDDPWYATCERQAQMASAIREADRAFVVNDRRRIF